MQLTKRTNRRSLIISLVILLAAAGALILSNLSGAGAEEDVANQKRKEVSEPVERWKTETKSLKSSNPFDYTHTPAFQELTGLGPDYLPYLMESVEQDQSLTSFVLTDAVIKVSKAKEAKTFVYENSGAFVVKWKEYERSIPERYNKIKEQKKEELAIIAEISDLGAPVVPLLIEDIESHDDVRFVQALVNLLPNEASPQDNEIEAWKKWSKEHGGKYKVLKAKDEIVE